MKKSLFIPRKQDGINSKWVDWNNKQPIIDGIRINQYTHDGLPNGYWEFTDGCGTSCNFINGIVDGYITSIEEYFDEIQIIKYIGNYNNFERDGLWIGYYDNGKIHSKINWVNGVMDGVCKTYYKDGKLKSKFIYRFGKSFGKHVEFYENGKIFKKGRYFNDIVSGREWIYYDNGQLLQYSE